MHSAAAVQNCLFTLPLVLITGCYVINVTLAELKEMHRYIVRAST